MGGWSGEGKDTISWDGTIKGKFFSGDGSALTGLAAGSGDVSASVALTDETIVQGDGGVKGVKTSTETIAHLTTAYNHSQDNTQAHSDYLLNTGDTGTGDYTFSMTDNTADIFTISEGANHYMCCDTTNGSENIVFGCGADPTIMTITSTLVSTEVNLDVTGDIIVSGSVDGVDVAGLSGFVTSNTTHRASGAIHFSSGAIWTAVDLNTDKTSYTDAAAVAANTAATASYATHAASSAIHFSSEAIYSTITGVYDAGDVASGALVTHVADSSDPHGATLTQANLTSSNSISGARINVTGDVASGACVNVYSGTSATPPAANTTTLNSLYVQYTA